MDFGGGKIVLDVSLATHIVVATKSEARRIQEFRHADLIWFPSLLPPRFLLSPRLIRHFRDERIPRLVTTDWLEESIREKTLLDEERFAPVGI